MADSPITSVPTATMVDSPVPRMSGRMAGQGMREAFNTLHNTANANIAALQAQEAGTTQSTPNLGATTKVDSFNFFNVLAYGVVGDATTALTSDGTDNYSALLALINSLPSGATLFFPKGVYRTSGGFIINKSIRIVGESGSVIKRSGTTGCPSLFYIGGAVPNGTPGCNFAGTVYPCGTAILAAGANQLTCSGSTSGLSVGQTIVLLLGIDTNDHGQNLVAMHNTITAIAGSVVTFATPFPENIQGPDWQPNYSYGDNGSCNSFLLQPAVSGPGRSGNAGGYSFMLTAGYGVSTHLSGLSEPTWPQTVGNTVTDGNFTWKNIGALAFPTTADFSFSPTTHRIIALTNGPVQQTSIQGLSFIDVAGPSYDQVIFFRIARHISVRDIQLTSTYSGIYFQSCESVEVDCIYGGHTFGAYVGISGCRNAVLNNLFAKALESTGVYMENNNRKVKGSNIYLQGGPSKGNNPYITVDDGSSEVHFSSVAIENINNGNAQALAVLHNSTPIFEDVSLLGPYISAYDLHYHKGLLFYNGQKFRDEGRRHRVVVLLEPNWSNKAIPIPKGLIKTVRGSLSGTTGVTQISLGNTSNANAQPICQPGGAGNIFRPSGAFGDFNWFSGGSFTNGFDFISQLGFFGGSLNQDVTGRQITITTGSGLVQGTVMVLDIDYMRLEEPFADDGVKGLMQNSPIQSMVWQDYTGAVVLTSTQNFAKFTPDRAITVTRVQVHVDTAPASNSTSAVIQVTDGTNPVNLTLTTGGGNDFDSGAISQDYAAGTPIQIKCSTAAAGGTAPLGAHIVVQYRTTQP